MREQPDSEAASDVWSFRAEQAARVDVTGFRVEAADGEIGTVDQATHDVGRSHLVVDTGPWIFGKKVVLPAGVVERVDPESETVFVSPTKDEIRDAPKLDPERDASDDRFRARLGSYYGAGRSGTHPNEPGFTS
jgi:hypothetical protein